MNLKISDDDKEQKENVILTIARYIDGPWVKKWIEKPKSQAINGHSFLYQITANAKSKISRIICPLKVKMFE